MSSELRAPRWVRWTLLAVLAPVGAIPVMGAGAFTGAAVASVTPVPFDIGVVAGAFLPVVALAVLVCTEAGPITIQMIDRTRS